MKYLKTPNSDEVERELGRERYKRRYRRTLQSTIVVLITAAALAVLVATLWLPVLQLYGSSMAPTLHEGEIVVSLKYSELEQGDVVAFYYGNKLLVKRYIAGPGSWVDIQADGTILVDGVALEEPYIQEKAFGNCDLELPYQVPDGKYFLVGDHRETSIDSRHSTVGCIAEDEIVGKIVYRIWPMSGFGPVE
ncbi:MAG: signal peptidase I [Oscillospiraceae bacterium]|nr:signal peptidase I [Oscillospiraceae bacterium]